ncbi:MAG TPA: RNA 2',3'-cyclic phosphodiesterase [Actinomycetota bacterium]|nr:RNA 2',3'-cyclic phosphodiesterase [Actinomycetota bacterium]
MPGEKLRLFVAVDVPRQHLETIEAATAPLRAQWPDARWAPLDNQHITVKFLGSTDGDLRAQVDDVCRSVAQAHDRSSVSLTSLGAFPSARRMRVLWIGLDDSANLLSRLASGLDEGFASLGYRVEKRDFTAHLTLARWRVPIRVDVLPEVDLSGLHAWTVDRLALYRSRLSPRGATYELLEEFLLR